jgi:Rod binding domain-containing protein
MESPRLLSAPPKAPAHDPALWKAAQALESNFIAEMLKDAKIGAPREDFGGGVGEEQFASMLQDKQAGLLERRGGFGLAESIYRAMKKDQTHG